MLRLDRETSERVRHDLALRSDPGLAQRSLDGSHHRGDRVRVHIGVSDEEVEVVGPPVNLIHNRDEVRSGRRPPAPTTAPSHSTDVYVSVYCLHGCNQDAPGL